MIAKYWKRVVLALGVFIVVALLLLRRGAKAAFEEIASSDEQTHLESSLTMLDGRLHLGLYRQPMWDALLWTVMASPDSLPAVLAAPNGVITNPLSLVYTSSQLGFREPPLTLRAVSTTDAAVCDARGCRTVQCPAPGARCSIVTSGDTSAIRSAGPSVKPGANANGRTDR